MIPVDLNLTVYIGECSYPKPQRPNELQNTENIGLEKHNMVYIPYIT